MHFSVWVYLLLFATGALAGAVDAIAGGGGIITVPMLLSVGLPVPLALGTNKLQATFGSMSAAWHYARAKLVDLRTCKLGVCATLVGSVVGAWCVQRLDATLLKSVVPWLLAGIAVYTLLRPRVGEVQRPPRVPSAGFFLVFGLLLGFYDGFFGPGTGSFWTIAIVTLLGMNFLRATATTKGMNATSNAAALALFAAGGQVDYSVGVVMGVGQLLGARLGARLALTRGEHFVRSLFVTMVVAVIIRLLWTQFTSSR